MVRLTEELRGTLKKPLGQAGPLETLLPKAMGKKIIAVGDQVVFNLLRKGIRPHLSVFDFRTRREEVGGEVRELLEKEYPEPHRISNEPGTVSEALFLLAPSLIEAGGAVLVEGEEDLAALPFIYFLKKEFVVLYGQPGEGCVLVEYNGEGRKRIKEMAGKLGLASLAD